MTLNLKTISLNLPKTLLTELTELAKAFGTARSRVILEAIRRSIPALRQEASRALHQRQLRAREFGEWTQ